MSTDKKIQKLRSQLLKNDLDACIIPSTDPHMGEYVPDHWAERAWISGFTGSAGTVVITKDFAGLWTDSRYFIQAEKQLEESEMQLMKLKIPHTPEHIDWIKTTLKPGSRIAVNGRMISVSIMRSLSKAFSEARLVLVTNRDLITEIWTDRPSLPDNMLMEHSTLYAGNSREEKIQKARELMASAGATHHLICSLDEIAWLFNLRGSDIAFNPLFVSYALITPKETMLFVNRDKIHYELLSSILMGPIRIFDYQAVQSILSELPQDACLLIDPGKTNQALMDTVPDNIRIVETMGPVTKLKAIKNNTEISGLRKVMIKDGTAWVKFLCWLNQNIGKEKISELSASNRLAAFRAEQDLYQGPSFYPISSYGNHGSIVHYAVDEESDIELHPAGIYLCDTGGHYLDGTTDTTRTVTLGEPTTKQKTDFTLALKGTLGVSMLRFPAGTKGYQMDILARKALWDNGLNFGHGTGHGVGFFLNVHEGPQTIGTGASGNMNTSFEPGMVTTVEPGLYRKGSHGIRTENMTLCVRDIETVYGQFYSFETLTLVPIDLDLILKNLLSDEEIIWINEYHQRIYKELKPYLSDTESDWLNHNTRKL